MDVVLDGVLVSEGVDLLGIRERVVDLDERVPLVGQRVLGENRLNRALRLACPAVDALLRIDDEDPLELVDAVDRADVDTGLVFDVGCRCRARR
ncbi:MAG: putative ferredoxin [Thermoleophilia bacterium]|nr:putative ferredoxin [Thermoleophilia bacterium]